MATISTLVKDGTLHQTRGAERTPYFVENLIDLADVVTEKGSAIAQGDIVQAIHVPAGSWVLSAGFQVVEEMEGTSTDATIDMGITGVNADAYVDGFDLDGASAGAFATAATTASEVTQVTTADTIDLLVATQTNTITGGVLRVWALLLDVSNKQKAPGIVQLGT